MNDSKRNGWRQRVAALVTALLSGVTLAACTGLPRKPELNTGDYRPVLAYLDRYIRQMMRKHHIVGLSIAVLDDQHIAWRAGFGFADQAEGVAANADTRYRAGSISKIFTTAAVMQLAEADRIDLDAPLVAVLPEFAIQSREPNPRPITPRMLMNHHSGLPGDIAEGMWTDRPAHFSAVIGALRETYRSYPPNLVHAYSNIGFDLLGSTIERVSGLVYESYLRERLLTPLGMSNSAFEIAPPIATQAYDRRGKPAEEPALRDTPAGGLNTSAPELLQFARMLFAAGLLGDTRVLGAASVAEMQRPQNAASPLDADLRVGLGWHFAPDAVRGGGPVLMHDGGTINHRAVLMLLPEHKLAVAVLSNTASALEPAMAIAGQALALFLEAKTGVRQPDEPIGTYRFPAAPAEAFPGHYASELGFLTIRDRRGRLVAEVGGKRLLLDRRDNGYHGLEYRLLGLIPIDLDKLGRYQLTRARIAGHELLLAGEAGAFYLAAERIEPVSIPPAWTARLGRWTYSGRDRLIAEKLVKSGVELKIVDGFLLAEVEGEGGVAALALEPIADDAAIVRGLGRGRGETVHALGAGVGETLRYAGMTFTRERGASGP